jgi:hypothetical protein
MASRWPLDGLLVSRATFPSIVTGMLRDPRLRYTDKSALLESRDLVSRAFQEMHSRQIGADKVSEIVAHVSQGKAYFSAASESDELVRPLLQYYGVLATVRAFILLKSPGLRETALYPGHGLNAIGWKDHLSTGGSWLDARLRIDGGTFSQLAEVTGNKEVVEIIQLDAADLRLEIPGTSTYPAAYEFRVRDIIGRLPDLTALFEAIDETPAAAWWCNITQSGDTFMFELMSNTRGLPTIEETRALFGLEQSTEVSKTSVIVGGWGPTDQLTFSVQCAPAALTAHLKNVSGSGGSSHVISPLPPDIVLSQISLLLAASYALGMLVRYFPTQWMSLLGRGSGDRVLPLIRSLSTTIENFPSVVTSYL